MSRGLGSDDEVEVSVVQQPPIFLVQLKASPRIRGGIVLLLIGQDVILPVGELLSLADAPAEEVGIEFLQAFVCDSQLFHAVLQIDETHRLETGSATKRQKIVVQ